MLKCYNYSDRQSPIPRTEEYRARLSQSLKDWWSVPENKDPYATNSNWNP